MVSEIPKELVDTVKHYSTRGEQSEKTTKTDNAGKTDKAKPTKAKPTRVPIPIGGKVKPSKTKKNEYNYTMGPREGNTRIVGPGSVSTHVQPLRLGLSGLLASHLSGLNTIDGEISGAKQGKRGDCYLLAAINSIRNTEDGQAIFKKNIKQNKDGSITVTLPGAVAVRNQYIREGKGDGCEITGVYHITSDALQKAIANAGKSYSNGDLEVIALEIAMENYRAEMVVTKQNLGIDSRSESYTAEASTNHLNDKDYLGGGYQYDATFILTGQKSDVYRCSKNKYNTVKPYKSGEYGYITREEMERRESSKISAGMREKGYSEVLHVTRNDSDLQRMLNKYQGHEDDFALGFGVRVAENCPDGSTKAGGGHALSVVKITDTTVYVANSWNPDQIEPIPRKEFEKMATEFTATKMNNRAVSQNYLQNSLNNVALGAGGSVSSADMASLSAILGRINLGNSHTQPSGGSNRIIPEKVQAYLNHFNNNHNNSPNKLNMNKLLKYLNNVSKKEVNKEQQDFVARMYKQITSSKEVELSKDDVKILKSLTDK